MAEIDIGDEDLLPPLDGDGLFRLFDCVNSLLSSLSALTGKMPKFWSVAPADATSMTLTALTLPVAAALVALLLLWAMLRLLHRRDPKLGRRVDWDEWNDAPTTTRPTTPSRSRSAPPALLLSPPPPIHRRSRIAGLDGGTFCGGEGSVLSPLPEEKAEEEAGDATTASPPSQGQAQEDGIDLFDNDEDFDDGYYGYDGDRGRRHFEIATAPLTSRSPSADAASTSRRAHGGGRILGPSVTSINFTTSVPPHHRPGVFRATEFRSIQRSVRLDIKDLTVSIHPPAKDGRRRREGGGGGNDVDEDGVTIRFRDEPELSVPIDRLIDASAVPPARGGVLEFTVVLPSSTEKERGGCSSEKVMTYPDEMHRRMNDAWDATRNAVTMENWHDMTQGTGGAGSAVMGWNKRQIRRGSDDADDVDGASKHSGGGEEVQTVQDGDVRALAAVGRSCDLPLLAGEPPQPSPSCTPFVSHHSTSDDVETLEHTFDSAPSASEFQRAVLALKAVGREIRNLYSALELVNAGSEAFDGNDGGVLMSPPSTSRFRTVGGLDGEGKEKEKRGGGTSVPQAGVALDDVLRCLGEIPSLRQGIDRLYSVHYGAHAGGGGGSGSGTDAPNNGVSAGSASATGGKRTLITSAADAATATSGSGPADADASGKGEGEPSTAAAKRASSYVDRRLVLGYVDFFRLFLPPLSSSASGSVVAIPYVSPTAAPSDGGENGGIESHHRRAMSLVRMRKRVGKAALYVRSYIRARAVVNEGWVLPVSSPSPVPTTASTGKEEDGAALSTAETTDGDANDDENDNDGGAADRGRHPHAVLTRRLAFDDDDANILHDALAKNEYYEATVSRDVRVDVHSREHLLPGREGSSRPSQYQGYALVGCHAFRLPASPSLSIEDNSGEAHPLQATRDPVEALPSLCRIIEINPDLDFFVHAFFPEGLRVAVVVVFVRSLPRGVDKSFDKVIDTFIKSNEQVRNRKLEVFMQLGPSPGLSALAWAALKTMSLVLNWTRKGEAQVPFKSGGGVNGRTCFPGMTMSSYTTCRHFGGVLQKNQKLPTNYIASTTHVDGENIQNLPVRLLYQHLQDGALPGSVVDFTFVLEGEREEELPERCMATIRMVHVDGIGAALPVSYSAQRNTDALDREKTTAGDAALSTVSYSAHTEAPTYPSSEGSMFRWLGFGTRPASTTSQAAATSTPIETIDLDDGVMANNSNAEKDLAEEKSVQSENISPSQKELGSDMLESNNDDDSDPYKVEIDALKEILDDVTVPVRKASIKNKDVNVVSNFQVGTNSNKDATATEVGQNNQAHGDMVHMSVLHSLTRSDLLRYYVASDYELKTAAVRLVESAAWRGVTFPIDTRVCRIELQSGQFFQQGVDKFGNPVFYFRNMCLGPWRKDIDAVVFAVLHRLEAALSKLTAKKTDVRCTVVVFMGQPIDEISVLSTGETKRSDGDKAGSSSTTVSSLTTEEDKSKRKRSKQMKNNKKQKSHKQKQFNPFFIGSDPRIDPEEEYQVHTNYMLVQRLNEVLSRHYPERLSKALIVPSGGWIKTLGSFGLRAYVPAQQTRARVAMLNNAEDLKKFIDINELVTFVGGKALVHPSAFEC